MIFEGRAPAVVAVGAALVVAGCSSSGSSPMVSTGSSTVSTDVSRSGSQRAVVEMRPVLVERAPDLTGHPRSVPASVPPTAAPTVRPSDASDPAWITPDRVVALERLDCPAVRPAPSAAPAEPRVACAAGLEAYLLGPAELTGSDVERVSAQPEPGAVGSPGARWTIMLTLTDAGRDRLAAATRRVASLPAPRNQLAVVVDGVVLAAPRVAEAITGGSLQITGDFDHARAADLAGRLSP